MHVGRSATYQMVENLVPNYAHHLEALLASHRIDEHVSVDTNEMFRIEYAVFILHLVRILRRSQLLWRVFTWPAVSMISVA